MRLSRKQIEPFIFQLIQDVFPEEDVRDGDHRPSSTRVVCLLIALAGAAALLYSYTFGPLSRP